MSATKKVVDYQKAIQNLTDVLIDNTKLQEMGKNIFDAIDTDSTNTLHIPAVISFFMDFLEGTQIEGELNTSFVKDHEGRKTFQMLLDNEAGEITLEELNQFLTHMLKIQVDCLRVKLEK